MIQRQRLSLILGIGLAIVAVIMVNIYLRQQTQMIRERTLGEVSRLQEMQATVIVAKRDIPKGTTIDAAMLEMVVIPREYVQPKAVSAPERILEMMTVAPISEGEQITLTKLLSPTQIREGGSLAMATPVGKRAISIPVDTISSLMGMIRPGDYVDVIAMLPIPARTPEGEPATQTAAVALFQNVLVLAAGQRTSPVSPSGDARYKEEQAEVPLITLALNPQEANLIAFVQEQARIRLILRSPADSKVDAVQPASWDTVFQYVMPSLVPKKPAPDGKETVYIDVYRGLKKEQIPLSE
jgi:pilus assembly protein CpaB